MEHVAEGLAFGSTISLDTERLVKQLHGSLR